MKRLRENGKLIKTALVSLLVLILGISIAFALPLFSSNVKIEGEAVNGQLTNEIGSTYSELEINFTQQPLSFKHSGDFFDIDLTVKNNSKEFFSYYFGLTLTNGANSSLKNAILVYFDGEFLGTLGGLCGYQEATIDKDLFVLPLQNGTAGQSSNKLRFELHNAAESSIYNNKSVTVKVISYAHTANYQQVTLVESFVEFKQAVNETNLGIGNQIVLAKDITLQEPLVLLSPLTINLFGSELAFGEHNLSLEDNAVLTLKSSKAAQYTALKQESGGFYINGQNAYLNITDFYSDSGAVNVAALYGAKVRINNYDKAKVADIIMQKTFGGFANIKSQSSLHIFSAMYFYTSQASFIETASALPIEVLLQSGGLLSYDVLTGILTAGQTSITKIEAMTIGGKSYEIKVIGNDDEAIKESILTSELAHIPLPNLSFTPNISYDLFLPTTINAKNAVIKWTTDNDTLLDSTGKIGTELSGDTTVTLTAEIRINSSVFVQHYTFKVYSQNNATRLLYFLSKINPLYISEVNFEIPLPTADSQSAYYYRNSYSKNYNNNGGLAFSWNALEDIGLESVTYKSADGYDFITVSGNNVYLNQPVFYTFAQLEVEAKFESDEEIYTGTVNILISLGDNTELLNMVFNYIDGEISEIDILQNIIDTRIEGGMANESGDFELISNYMNYYIYYESNEVNNNILTMPQAATPNIDGRQLEPYNITVNAENFFDTDTALRLTAYIYNPNISSTMTPRDFYINSPGAIHKGQSGFSVKSVFDSVKYQVWQQLAEEERKPNLPSGFSQSGGSVTFNNIKDYILLRDIKQTAVLAFSNNQENKLMQLLSWAVSTSNSAVKASDITGITNITGASTKSDGKNYISTDEAAAIKAYAKSINSQVDWDNLWADATYTPGEIYNQYDMSTPKGVADYARWGKKYIITDTPALSAEINTEINLSGRSFAESVKANVFFKYSEVLLWLLDERDFGENYDGGWCDMPNASYVGKSANESGNSSNPNFNYRHNAVEDNLPYVSQMEYEVMLNFWRNIGSNATTRTAMQNIWKKYIIEPTYYRPDGILNLYLAVYGESANYYSNFQTKDGVNYPYIPALDQTLDGLEWFENLEKLYIEGKPFTNSAADSPIFTNSQSIEYFFNRLTRYNTKLEKLVMQNASIKDYSPLELDGINRLNNLTYIDFKGCTGIARIGALTEFEAGSNLGYIDLSQTGCEFEEIKHSLSFLYFTYFDNPENSGVYPDIYYSTNIRYEPSSSDRSGLMYLSYLSDRFEVESQYLQLTKHITTDSGSAIEVEWELKNGNPVIPVGTANERYFVPTSSGLSYNSVSLTNGNLYFLNYTYATNSFSAVWVSTLTNSTSSSNLSSAWSTYSSGTSTATTYYYYTGAATDINGTRITQNSIVMLKTIDGLKNIILLSAGINNRRFSSNNNITNWVSGTVTTENATNVNAMNAIKNNAKAYMLNNLYYFLGADAGGYISSGIYKLVRNGSVYSFEYMNKSVTKEGSIDNFIKTPVLNGASYYNNGDAKVYHFNYSGAAGTFTWTYLRDNLYEMDYNTVTGIYYFKSSGDAQLIENGNFLMLKNLRYYDGIDFGDSEGKQYGGRRGTYTVTLTATITVGGNKYTREFTVDIIG